MTGKEYFRERWYRVGEPFQVGVFDDLFERIFELEAQVKALQQSGVQSWPLSVGTFNACTCWNGDARYRFLRLGVGCYAT